MKLDDLFESSINRIRQHVEEENTESWAIMTSWRAENTPQQNKSDFKRLESDIRSNDLGYIKLIGHGQEEDAEGKVSSVKEPSLFIPNMPLMLAKKLMKKYNQYGFVYGGKETGDKATLFSIDGKEVLGKFQPNKLGQFYSELKGKPFRFS